MDSGLGSDEDRRSRTKEQKQRHNQQLLSGCFIDAASLTDDGEVTEHRRNDERRQGALIFQTSIPQFSMLQIPDQSCAFPAAMSASCTSLPVLPSEPDTPYNSIVQLDDETEEASYKTPLGFYVDLNDIQDDDVSCSSSTPSASVKKNIFSMVIDFEAPKKDMPSRLSSSLVSRRKIGNERTLQIKADSRKEPTKKRSSLSSSLDSRSFNGNSSDCSESRYDLKVSINAGSVPVQSSSSDESLQHEGEQSPVQKYETEEEEKKTKRTEQNTDQDTQNELTNNKTNEMRVENGGNHPSTTNKVSEPAATPNSNTQKFVKLSDLERQAPRVDYSLAPKMSRSIPESSWVESPLLMSRSAGYRSAPHPMEPESSELSDTCSMTDTTTSQPRKSVQRLGTDLLRMFLEEIGPDVTVEVDGHRLRAHKCILASRCQYFAAMLSGNWLEASGNVISLQGFTYESVYFALCHIYSGAAHVPDSISLVELASLADMLGLEGLKEVVEHALKQRHCHNFHRPCAGCCTGVVEVLPLAAACGLDTLYQKCLQWVTQHFAKVWPSRAFAALPKELREKCYQQHIVHMSSDTVLETTLACDKLLSSVPSLRWAEPVVQLGLQLADACQLYVKQHFTAVLASASFLALETGVNWNISQVEECLIAAASNLGPEQACRSYSKCHKMLEQNWETRFMQLIVKLKVHVEQCLIAQAEKACRCAGWSRMDPILRTRIKEITGLPLDEPPHTRLPRATSARLKKYAQSQATKANKGNAPASSSDSSRNSSPGVNQTQTHVYNKSTGSPSLRRSLLLAARAPQIPPSPSVNRRSTLTRPTASSAAKTAPSKNLKSPLKAESLKPAVKPSPRNNMNSMVRNGVGAANKIVRETNTSLQRQKKSAQIVAENAKKVQSFGGKKSQDSPKLTGVTRNGSAGSVPSSPRKSVRKSQPEAVKKATVQRSDTFLKEEPTVLKKC